MQKKTLNDLDVLKKNSLKDASLKDSLSLKNFIKKYIFLDLLLSFLKSGIFFNIFCFTYNSPEKKRVSKGSFNDISDYEAVLQEHFL